MTPREAMDDLRGTVCRSCGGPKKSMKSSCRGCFMRLPVRMRSALYRRFGDGYEQAYEASLKFLKERAS